MNKTLLAIRSSFPKWTVFAAASLYSLLLLVNPAYSNTPTKSDSALLPYSLDYAATYNGMDINANRELTLESGQYTLSTTAKNMLSNITEHGEFTVNSNGTIIDQGYEYKRSILGIKKTEKLTYDYKAGTAKYKSKKKKRKVALKNDQLNRLSYQIQLRRDLINGKSPLEYQVISRGRLKIYKFEIQGEETLETPLGNIKAVKVKRIRKDNDRETLLWFAPQWNYLLVQLWQREKGGEDYKIVLQQGSLNGTALK